ncbi:polynucleotide 5'-hydroxyl-kinase NOL9 [Drosophila montana]|uniref:polynucleotide 5'-hydroxyl-kinase NOL9 n=1 Tax=Drosophila montana TaxID=40370 RepID=UPI00313E9EDA
MSLKCNERVLKEIQASFKLTENRKAKPQSAPTTATAWQPVQQKPKVALCNPQKVQTKPTANQKAPKQHEDIKVSVNDVNIKPISKSNQNRANLSKAEKLNADSLRTTENTKIKKLKQATNTKILETSEKAAKNQSTEEIKVSFNKVKNKTSSESKTSPETVLVATNTNKEETKAKNKAMKAGKKRKIISGKFKNRQMEAKQLNVALVKKENQKENKKKIETAATDYKIQSSKAQILPKSGQSNVILNPNVAKRKAKEVSPTPNGSHKRAKNEKQASTKATNINNKKNASKAIDKKTKTNRTLKKSEANQKSAIKAADVRIVKDNRDDELSDDFDEQAYEIESVESFDQEEYSENSESEYSLDSEEDFFTKPQVYECEGTEQIPLGLEHNGNEDEEKMSWLGLDKLPEVQADVTKISVFDGMMPEPEPELQTKSGAEALPTAIIGDDNDVLSGAEDEEHSMEMSPDLAVDIDDVADQQLAGAEANMGFYKDAVPSELSIFENSLKTNNVLAVLKQDIELYGTVIVTLLCGRITINGYKARPKVPLSIYSPKGFSWVVIAPRSNKKPPKANVNWNELNESFSRAQLDNIMANYDSQRDAIVLLQRNSGSQNMLDTFAKHMAENVYPLLNATNRPHYASEYVLNCLMQAADGRQALQVPTVWTKLALQPRSRWMVTGGKGVGKSTLVRYLLNRHLERFPRMLLIDLDIGQPELFLPQTVSCSVVDGPLLGPGFFLNRQPDRAYVVGHVNVVMCSEQYIRAVRQLLAYCRSNESYAEMPWLINTMGYNKGFGLELMALLVDCVQPTNLVQIASAKVINNFDMPLTRESLAQVVPIIYTADEHKVSGNLSNYALHELHSALPQLERHERRWMMSAKDVRYANLLARLSSALRGNAKHLTDCQPAQVDLDALQIVHLVHEEYTREELIAGMEANLVFLCKAGSSVAKPAECLGIGVVRAIDHEARKLYLLPAMPLQRLSSVNCLVLGGDMCLPQGFFKDQGAGVANNVPFVFIIDDTRSSKSIHQIYFRAHKNV